MNALSDVLLTYLITLYTRVYRNKPPQGATLPYIVFNTKSANDTYPSDDVQVNINIFDKVDASVRIIETLADTIDAGLAMKLISNASINAHFKRDNRQYENDPEMSGKQFINLQYTCRVYKKGE